ncbi:MAG: hypothetical protein JWN69_1430 [Alphaproteobacteria bacterium]|nr:hypothetical protein [Alphaproteobacteria bacterium]
MISEDSGWIASQFARLSTGLKMLLILSVGLFPLGLIAILASVQSAQQNRADEQDEIVAQIALSAQRLDAAISRSALTIHAASIAVAATPPESGICEATLRRLSGARAFGGSYALYAGGRLRCATPGFVPPPLRARPPHRPDDRARDRRPDRRTLVEISQDGDALRFALLDDQEQVDALGQYSRAEINALAATPASKRKFDLELVQDGRRMMLHDDYQPRPWASAVRLSQPVGDGQLELRMVAAANPISAAELLMILLPVMMWISAAAIGWLIVDRLLLKPLVRMQRAISEYRPGDREIALPELSTPAREIGELGQAFDKVARTVARHEAELEAAVARQTRLVREVHHRVKNNLQVVASLLNLHARGSRNEDVAAAYASIQRRVDALAVVHRNHYAELEENRGVALKPLISELAANLRATAPSSAAHMAISVNIESYYVTQDVAVSVAFLITEIIEFVMFSGAAPARIALTGNEGGRTATLVVESESLRGETNRDAQLFDRFDRIVTGLSRQLRSTIERDSETGRYSLAVMVIDKGDG